MPVPMAHELEAAREILTRFLPKPPGSFELAALDIAEVIARHRIRQRTGRDSDGFTPEMRQRIERGRHAGQHRAR